MSSPAQSVSWLARRSLRVQIVALFVGLLLALQATSLMLVSSRIEAGARESTRKELDAGRRIFERLLQARAEYLTEAGRLMVADFGFRSAVAAADRETLMSALVNHGARIGADFVLYADAALKPVVSTLPEAERLLPRVGRDGGDGDGVKLLAMTGNHLYQVVAVPVKAPLVIGWVVMGFELKQPLLDEVKSMAATDVALLVTGSDGKPRIRHATLPQGDFETLAQAWADSRPAIQERGTAASGHRMVRFDAKSTVRGDSYLTASQSLVDEPGQQASVLLLRSLAEATEPYRRISALLLAVTGLAALLFATGGMLTARRITDPLGRLAAMARRLGRGDYSEPVALQAGGELRELGDSFEAMRQAIRERDRSLHRIAYEDALTKLPNREAFRTAVDEAVQRGEWDGGRFGLLMLNLDRFKLVNTVLGQPVGDQLLREVTARLQRLQRASDLVARLGSDEFVLLLGGADSATAMDFAHRIHADFQTPMLLGAQAIDMSASIGLVVYPEHGTQAEPLLARLDLAMRASKRQRVPVAVYEPAADTASQQSLSLLGELRSAVLNDQLELLLQPKVAFGSGKVVGAEALVRWRHPVRGVIPPGDFIPFAEQTGFIRELTRWVIEQGTTMLRDLQANGHGLRLSINLSVRDLLDQDLPRKMQDLAELHATAPVTLCLEITESAIMDDPQRAMLTLENLHAMGFKLSIDDFGTGYSSLAYLRRLPVDELKIDKSFVLNMDHDVDDAKIVRSVIDLGHNLGLKVVAEGVETAKIWKLLEALGCDEGQGYLIARPMAAADLSAWVDRWTSPRTDDVRIDTAFATLF